MVRKKVQVDSRFWVSHKAQAMQGSIKAGLIELITNSDDAYVDSGSDGPIIISISAYSPDRFRLAVEGQMALVVSVTDEAGGVTPDKLEDKFLHYGGATSALAEGRISRGIMGRGSKDAAIFGALSVESLSPEGYSELMLLAVDEADVSEERRKINEADRERVGVGKGKYGLCASILVSAENLPSVPKLSSLIKGLENEAQLRRIIPDRMILIRDDRTGEEAIVQEASNDSTELFTETFELGSPFSPATLKVYRLREEQAGRANSTTMHGIFIHCGRSGFENSWFGFENTPGNEWIRAELELPDALDIQKRGFDDRLATGLLLHPDRTGINRAHEYFKAAITAITPRIYEVLGDVASKQRSPRAESEAMKQANKLASDVVGRLLKELAEELEDTAGSGERDTAISDFDLIPSTLRVAPGSSKSISLRVSKELIELPVQVLLGDEPRVEEAVLGELGKNVKFEWLDHPMLERKITQWRFTAGQESGLFSVAFVIGGIKRECNVLIAEGGPAEEKVPSRLSFERDRYKVAPGKGKNLRVIAPLSFVGTSVSLEIGDLEIDVPSPVVLGSSSQGLRAEGIFHISSPRAEGHATLIATGNTPEDVATAELIVKFDSGMSGFRPRFEISTDPKPRYRSLLKKASDGVLTSYIFPEHPSYLGAFGKFDGQKFLSEESDDVRAIIAITHAERIAAYMAERSGEKNPDWDVAKNLQVFFDKHQQLAEILGKIFSESDSG